MLYYNCIEPGRATLAKVKNFEIYYNWLKFGNIFCIIVINYFL